MGIRARQDQRAADRQYRATLKTRTADRSPRFALGCLSCGSSHGTSGIDLNKTRPAALGIRRSAREERRGDVDTCDSQSLAPWLGGPTLTSTAICVREKLAARTPIPSAVSSVVSKANTPTTIRRQQRNRDGARLVIASTDHRAPSGMRGRWRLARRRDPCMLESNVGYPDASTSLSSVPDRSRSPMRGAKVGGDVSSSGGSSSRSVTLAPVQRQPRWPVDSGSAKSTCQNVEHRLRCLRRTLRHVGLRLVVVIGRLDDAPALRWNGSTRDSSKASVSNGGRVSEGVTGGALR